MSTGSASADVYPRPDWVRPNQQWRSLNGKWDFVFDDEDVGLLQRWYLSGLSDQSKLQIQVPFAFQTPASGINDRGVHEVMWYERSISDIRTAEQKRKNYSVLLRFGAVDYQATVWLNGRRVGSHRGGHVPFDLDITDALNDFTAAAKLTVRVYDSAFNLAQPRGKQYWKPEPESIFYTPSGGIWQSVWVESVPAMRIADSSHGTVIRSDDIEGGEVHCKVPLEGRRARQKCSIELEASIGGVFVSKSHRLDLPTETDHDHMMIHLSLRMTLDHINRLSNSHLLTALVDNEGCWHKGVALWTTESPLLYDLTFRLFDAAGLVDEVKTTTGMRQLNWTKGDGTFRLNGRPYFQALVLDQGYWPETGMTPPSPDSLKQDIVLAKEMGFNGCRKHQKVEDPIFMYWADRLGYLVWGEIANAYEFNDQYVERFDPEWMEMVRRDINHPCVVAWTPANESWGYTSLKNNIKQRDHLRSIYYATKTLDPTRPINDNCGWEHVITDLSTFHEYADGPKLAEMCATLNGILHERGGPDLFVKPIPGDPGASHQEGAPVLCTEFGGVNIAPAKDDSAADKKGWGYTTASDPEDLLKRVERLVMAVVNGGHCCGFVYTQLSDIEQEVNGLYAFDRMPKLDVGKVKAIMDEAQRVYYQQLKGR